MQQKTMKNTIENKVKELLHHADININGNKPYDIQVHNKQFYSKIITGGSLALGESYMDKVWDCENLDTFFHKIITSDLKSKIKSINNLYYYLRAHIVNMQTKKGALNVIDQHYDLGNDLYEAFLDKRMLYTCGYWNDTAQNLEEAQEAKLDLSCKKLHLKPGMKVLEIGCGWGGFAKFAAEKYQVEVTGITISKNQKAYAEKVCKDLPVKILLQDYRDVEGQFDAIVVMGMVEHVGFKNYRTIFDVTSQCLKKDGLFLLHTIGDHFATPFGEPWSHKYIFPNSSLPSLTQLEKSSRKHFIIEDLQNFGGDYYYTLKAWHENFVKNWSSIEHNYDERFYRMWVYYLLSFAGSFKARKLQLWQIVLSKGELRSPIYKRVP